MPESKLNIRQQKFIQNLVDGMSQVKAYMEAGYECTYETAKVNASIALTKTNIMEALEKEQNERERIRKLKFSIVQDRLSDNAVSAAEEAAKLIDYSTPMDSVKAKMIIDALDRTVGKPGGKVSMDAKIGHEVTLKDIILERAKQTESE